MTDTFIITAISFLLGFGCCLLYTFITSYNERARIDTANYWQQKMNEHSAVAMECQYKAMQEGTKQLRMQIDAEALRGNE